MSECPKQLVARSVLYFSENDEDMFFKWLDNLACVVGYHGVGRDLLIDLQDGQLDDGSLRELLALFYRYNVDMSQFAAFKSDANRAWFGNPSSHWYVRVFGGHENGQK